MEFLGSNNSRKPGGEYKKQTEANVERSAPAQNAQIRGVEGASLSTTSPPPSQPGDDSLSFLLLTLKPFTPPSPKFVCGRESLPSNTPAEEAMVCGCLGDHSYR